MVEMTALMTPDPIVVGGGTPVAECARLMVRHDVRHLPVVDADGRAFGLVTDWDVFQRGGMVSPDCWTATDEGDQWLLARELARPIEVTARLEDRVAVALRALLRSFQDAIVVVDPAGRPAGIVTEHDAVRLATTHLEDDRWSNELPLHEPPTVAWDASLGRARALLHRSGGRHLLVTRGPSLRGVLSLRDLRRAPWQPSEVRVADVLHRAAPEYVVGAVSLRFAAARMHTQAIGCVPIVDRELRPRRMLTRADITRALASVLDPAGRRQGTSPTGWLMDIR